MAAEWLVIGELLLCVCDNRGLSLLELLSSSESSLLAAELVGFGVRPISIGQLVVLKQGRASSIVGCSLLNSLR